MRSHQVSPVTRPHHPAMTIDPVVLELPFRGRWLTQNSPARRVPSHGTDLLGVTYAIDFVAVDDRGRSAPRKWRSRFWVEPAELFRGFGAPVLAPSAGTVVVAHDGEADHVARRSGPARVSYALTQAGRVRAGIAAIAGNHVVIARSPTGPYVAVVHLRRGSVRVRPGDQVAVGDQIGECGNSGNSTEPHVHVQVTDTTEWASARGLPLAFRWPRGVGLRSGVGGADLWVPQEGEIVDVA